MLGESLEDSRSVITSYSIHYTKLYDGVHVPGGFATTAHAYREFIEVSGLAERIHDALDKLDVDDVEELARVGEQIRQWVVDAPFQPALEEAIVSYNFV